MSGCSVPARWAAVSDVGLVRRRNEDAFRILPEQGRVVLADGMGGHRAGDVAAQMAIDTFCAELAALIDGGAAPPAALPLAVSRANAAVYAAGRSDARFAGMGATLVAGVLVPEGLVYAHVGDSRLYRWRGGCLQQLTCDHTMLQDLVGAGMISPEQARQVPFRGLLTRALGVGPEIEVDVGHADLQAGDVLLLCSDGLTDMLEDDEIVTRLRSGGDVHDWATGLVADANAHGGRDNITVVLAQLG